MFGGHMVLKDLDWIINKMHKLSNSEILEMRWNCYRLFLFKLNDIRKEQPYLADGTKNAAVHYKCTRKLEDIEKNIIACINRDFPVDEEIQKFDVKFNEEFDGSHVSKDIKESIKFRRKSKNFIRANSMSKKFSKSGKQYK